MLLAGALAGCFDIKMEVDVVGPDKAVATIETTISKEIVDIAEVQSGESDFCDKEGKVIEGEDTVTCIETVEGTFAELEGMGEPDEPHPTFTLVNPRQVRVDFPISAWREDMNAGDDEESKQAMLMMKQMFIGHAMTLRIKGGEIISTNMSEPEPGVAEMVIPLTDLFTGTGDFPDEAYAVVQLP